MVDLSKPPNSLGQSFGKISTKLGHAGQKEYQQCLKSIVQSMRGGELLKEKLSIAWDKLALALAKTEKR